MKMNIKKKGNNGSYVCVERRRNEFDFLKMKRL